MKINLLNKQNLSIIYQYYYAYDQVMRTATYAFCYKGEEHWVR